MTSAEGDGDGDGADEPRVDDQSRQRRVADLARPEVAAQHRDRRDASPRPRRR